MDKKEFNMIYDVLENFDFEKVEDAMKHLGLKWFTTENPNGECPTLKELKEKAKELLVDAIEENSKCSSGGLCAELII